MIPIGFGKVLPAEFSPGGFPSSSSGHSPPVVVHNFNLVRPIRFPDVAHPPLTVHADTVLTFAVPECFQLIPRGTRKLANPVAACTAQFAPRHPLDVPNRGTA